MPINPYLNFNEKHREAVEFYARVFHLPKPQIQTFDSMPADPSHPLPPGAEKRVLHSRLDIDGTPVMFSDTMPGMPYHQGNNISLSFQSKDRGEVERVFRELAQGGKVTMPLQQTFWSKAYGQVKDSFGVDWQVNLDSGEMMP